MHLALAIRNRGYTNVLLPYGTLREHRSKLRVASRREVRLSRLRCASRTMQTNAKPRLFNLRRLVLSRVAATSSRLMQDISSPSSRRLILADSGFASCP
ncbi:MAG: hypothetical protein V7K68_22060 [Nostoc sp.]|uniref:hypothetical protein n=1 Tax=Nostoc sp. TaxID=1180 RepID=UPI002FFBD6CF